MTWRSRCSNLSRVSNEIRIFDISSHCLTFGIRTTRHCIVSTHSSCNLFQFKNSICASAGIFFVLKNSQFSGARSSISQGLAWASSFWDIRWNSAHFEGKFNQSYINDDLGWQDKWMESCALKVKFLLIKQRDKFRLFIRLTFSGAFTIPYNMSRLSLYVVCRASWHITKLFALSPKETKTFLQSSQCSQIHLPSLLLLFLSLTIVSDKYCDSHPL